MISVTAFWAVYLAVLVMIPAVVFDLLHVVQAILVVALVAAVSAIGWWLGR